jgi:RNA polymerase sigma-70 factor (ECF subfamily)
LRFATTNWSVIRKAIVGDSSEGRDALASLCETYWPPVYALIRGKGRSAADAEDLTQAYFTRFFEKEYVKDFRPEAGRFRTFLRASVEHFLLNEWDRERALKRGGGRAPLSLDSAEAEERYRREPVDSVTPEVLFERHWAAALLGRCLTRLREEQDGSGGGPRFEKLRPFLLAGGGPDGYSGLARGLAITEAAARVAVHRLRKRFCSVLREEVALTVADPADIDDEIRWLLTAVRGAV